MEHATEQEATVRVKAALVDPRSSVVVWSNDAAGGHPSEGGAETVRIEDAVPMAETLGVAEAVREVVETGVPRHLQADVVSKASGSITLVVSVYRLPEGMVLVLSENVWRAERPGPTRSGSRRAGRRTR